MMKEQEEGVLDEDMYNEVVIGDDGQPLSKLEVYKLSNEFKETRAEIEKLQPMRIGIFNRYWKRFKYNKKRR